MITRLIITLQDFIHLVWLFVPDLWLHSLQYSQEINRTKDETDCSLLVCHMLEMLNNKRWKIKFKLLSKLLRIYPYFKSMASWAPHPLPCCHLVKGNLPFYLISQMIADQLIRVLSCCMQFNLSLAIIFSGWSD